MARNQEQSPLLKLPAELRNHICHLALVSDSPVKITGPPNKDRRHRYLPPREPGLLQSCAQLRRECTAVYYSKNVFKTGEVFFGWVKRISQEKRNLIERIVHYDDRVQYSVYRAQDVAQYFEKDGGLRTGVMQVVFYDDDDKRLLVGVDSVVDDGSALDDVSVLDDDSVLDGDSVMDDDSVLDDDLVEDDVSIADDVSAANDGYMVEG